MILIFSQDKNEATTDCIIDWLDIYGGSYKRFNGIDFYKKVFIKIDNNRFEINLPNINWEKISLVWLRRWVTKENSNDVFINNPSNSDSIISQINEYNRSELKALLNFFFKSIPNRLLFSSIRTEEINKLLVLNKARELKLNIPSTFIITNRKDYSEIAAEEKLITKAISNGATINVEKEKYVGYTSEVQGLPSFIKKSFIPSLLQTKLKKKYEIRSFFLSGEFYSMAIFSQNDSQTEIDFRKYNEFMPNRTVPFKLPDEIKKRLSKLADFFGIRTGSFDLVKTQNNEYVFLEVNPGGQFEMISKPCNYFLEQKIAKELMKTAKKNENSTNFTGTHS